MKILSLFAPLLLASGLCCASEELVRALESEDVERAVSLIDAGVDVNAAASDGTTALHWAAYYGKADLVGLLISREAKVNVRNDYGSSPMTEAAVRGDHDILQLLLEAGADVESPNLEGQTALMAVSRTGNLEAAKLLLDHGADVNAAEGWGGQTALMWAAARHHPAMMRLLIGAGAEVEQRAIVRDWERLVTAEPRVKEMQRGGYTAMLYAAREACLACVEVLLEAGADINRPTPDNVSPLVLALLNMHYDLARYLLEHGADPGQWDYWGRTPLFAAVDLSILPLSARGDLPPMQDTSAVDVARMLLEAGVDPDFRLKLAPPPRNTPYDRAYDKPFLTTGTTPLLRAAYGADLDMMELLLSHGADAALANKYGFTPMLSLLTTGNTRGRDKTQGNVIKGIDLLLAAGASLDDVGVVYDFTNSAGFNEIGGYEGESLAHIATRLEWADVLSHLVERGADLQAKDAMGYTPLDYATGEAPILSAGNFGRLGELPAMEALIQRLSSAQE
ncbi:MAG TPA: ankyrin repeat domain-containing protein [Hyphomicrobiales bacterium]|nr:ankyrin repeat domain-containing protein [Hyphomicrobiales bacterium]